MSHHHHHQRELKPMLAAGVRGFKCFLVNSGVEEFEHVTEADLHMALPQLQATDSVLLVGGLHINRNLNI